jgi:transcriptional regulator with XRE-family HTH domain
MVIMELNSTSDAVTKLGANLRVTRKRRRLRIVDLAQAARCSQDTLRRLESGDPGVSLGVLARVMEAVGCAQQLALMMDAAGDADGLKSDVQRLPQRVRRSLLPVEKISAEQFLIEKRARQVASHDRVAKGEIPQSALFTFSKEQLRGAQFRSPESGFSAREDDDDEEQH